MSGLGEIFLVANQARADFEEKQISRDLLARLYLAYKPEVITPERGITDFLDAAEASFPRDNCGLASVYLKHQLGAGEVVTGEYDRKLHSFLLVSGLVTIENLVVDITADQFQGGPPVYAGALEYPWELPGQA